MIRVKELRESHNLAQKQLAIDLGVTQPTISDWESGRKIPSAKNTQRLADFFGVTTDYLLGRTSEPAPAPSEAETLTFPADLKELAETYTRLNSGDKTLIRNLIVSLSGKTDKQ